MAVTVLTTQREVDAWIPENVRPNACIEAFFAPVEPIDLSEWIGAHECCSMCGTATPGLRVCAGGGAFEETCAECGESGCLVTRWGTAQVERWESGDGDECPGPVVGLVVVVGGDAEHAASLIAQARSWFVASEVRSLH